MIVVVVAVAAVVANLVDFWVFWNILNRDFFGDLGQCNFGVLLVGVVETWHMEVHALILVGGINACYLSIGIVEWTHVKHMMWKSHGSE